MTAGALTIGGLLLASGRSPPARQPMAGTLDASTPKPSADFAATPAPSAAGALSAEPAVSAAPIVPNAASKPPATKPTPANARAVSSPAHRPDNDYGI